MSIHKRIHIKSEQKEKRRKRRQRLKAKGSNLDDFYYGRFYIGPSKK